MIFYDIIPSLFISLKLFMEENKINIPGAIILAGIIIAVAILLTNGKIARNDAPSDAKPQPQEITVAKVDSNEHILGNANAKIVVIEFSDTECPFCKQFHPTMQKIVADYKGEVAWVYRHFPLDKPNPQGIILHSKAGKEAEATECAGEQGGNEVFWQYLDKVFEITPSNDGLDLVLLPQIASELGLDVKTFNNCLSSGKYKNLIESQYQDGLKAGITGTPASIVVNQKTSKKTMVVGAGSYETIKSTIDSLK